MSIRTTGDGDLRPYVPNVACQLAKAICTYEGLELRITRGILDRVASLYFTKLAQNQSDPTDDEALHREGLGSTWRDELLAVTDASGTPHARVERAAVRPLGIATRAVHLVGVADNGSVWVQQRALDKATDPGLWDTLMGGLQSADESDAQTLERETWEEAGLRLADLADLHAAGRLVVRRPVADGYMVEHIEVFAAIVPDGRVPINRDGEVARFECLDPAALQRRIENGEFTLEAALILAGTLGKA